MKKQIVLFTTRPVTSKFTKSLIEQMSILKEFDSKEYDIVYLTHYSTDSAKRYIEEVAEIKIAKTVCIDQYYQDTIFNRVYPTWIEWYNSNHSDVILNQFSNVESIFVFGGLLSDATDFTREKNKLNRSILTQNQTKFMQNGYQMTGLFILIKLALMFDCKLNEICFDQCENSINLIDKIEIPKKYTLWHGYDVPNFGMKRLDSLQYYLLNKKAEVNLFDEPINKDLNLVFGMSVLTKDRLHVYDNLMKIDNAKLFVRNKFTGEDSFIERDEYLSYIKRAKYTLIMPTYDKTSFSIYRFIESIHNDCLPLIGNDCYIDEFIESFGLEGLTIIDYNKPINFPSEIDRLKSINYFKEKLFGNVKINKEMFLEK